MPSVLLTSFATWRSRQRYNSSDVLLEEIKPFLSHEIDWMMLRRLPVDAVRAEKEIRAAVLRGKPRLVVCCGMGGSCRNLVLERQARFGNARLRNPCRHMSALTLDLPTVRWSRHAGNFVCNETYFRVLKFTRRHRPRVACLFVHVPKVCHRYWPQVVRDFASLLQRLGKLAEAGEKRSRIEDATN